MPLTQTKNNERRVVPVNDAVAAVLKRPPRHLDMDLLFPAVNEPMITGAFWRACRKSQLLDLRFHDLRLTFASYLAMSGYNLRRIQQLLDHRDLRMTSRYSHLSADRLQQAVQSLDTILNRTTRHWHTPMAATSV
jgi:integrase